MRPLTLSDASAAIVQLQQEIQRSEESRYDHRLHGVLLVAQGMTCPEVSVLLGDAPRTIEYWVGRFEEQGFSGLQEGERPGRPARLSEKQLDELQRVLRAKPSDAGMDANLWDGKTLSALIERKYGVQLGVRQCQRMFRHFDFRLRKPRPMIAGASPALQKKHKKTPQIDARSGRRPLGTRRSALSTTRLALSYVGAAGDQGPSTLPSPHAAQHRILRSRTPAR